MINKRSVLRITRLYALRRPLKRLGLRDGYIIPRLCDAGEHSHGIAPAHFVGHGNAAHFFIRGRKNVSEPQVRAQPERYALATHP